MKRRPHYLPKNHATQIPSNCIWFDTETKPKIDDDGKQFHHLWFGYACFQRRLKGDEWEPEQWLRFTTIDQFWEWVISKTRDKTRLYLFSHNGAFDIPVVHGFEEMPSREFPLKNAIADAPPLILTWKKGSRTIRYIDTLNIWRMPLDSIGESIGFKKLPFPGYDASKKVWDIYGKRDVEVIKKVSLSWFSFLKENDLGGFSPTLASQAFNAYRHRFMPTPIFIDDNERAIEISRNSYVGGRVECFSIGTYEDDFYYIDVNSMYPSVMLDGYFPNKLVGVYKNPGRCKLDEWRDDFTMIADVNIKTDEPCYPIINNDKLIFPTGTFRVALAMPELCYAIDRGHVKKIFSIALYERAELFREFITEMYQMRLDAKAAGDEVNSWLYKILMNSLYGKFGQRGRVYKTVDTAEPWIINCDPIINADNGTVIRQRTFGGIVQHLQEDGESRESFPAIAAHVTSYARLKLWNAITQAGQENCLYCDTDSLVVNKTGFERISDDLDDKTLGKWALEKRLSSITLNGAKDYRFDDVVRIKGVRKNAEWLDANTVRQDHFVGLKGLLRSGQIEAPVVYSQTKRLSRIYDKGYVESSGRVRPWVLSGDGVRA